MILNVEFVSLLQLILLINSQMSYVTIQFKVVQITKPSINVIYVLQDIRKKFKIRLVSNFKP